MPSGGALLVKYYLLCLWFKYESYLRGERDVWTDTFPPHAEGAD